MERMRELIAILNEASMKYEQFNEEIISNFEYDRLYDELVELEKNTEILPESPTQKVGYEILSSLKKIRHELPMLSLDKTKDIKKLKSFIKDNQSKTGKSILSLKLDGLTVVLRYKNGVLDAAVTRGNGITGEDITHNAKVFRNIPRRINFNGELVLRGEAVIGFHEFERINENLPAVEKYKNPRNLCSGTVRQLNSGICADRNVHFIAISLVKSENMNFKLKSQQFEWLKELGFTVVENRLVTLENIENAVNDFKETATNSEYASDGLVITYDDIAFSAGLGSTSKFPRDSLAFKWADAVCETVLKEILWNTSRTGLINPVALFEPVELEGTTVNRASLHNVSILKRLQLGIGDEITVYKANMIIPQIADNLTRSGTYDIPSNCPACGGVTEIIKQNEGESLHCKNPNCVAKLISSLTHFASRDAMNIEGFSQSTIEKFIKRGYIRDYADIFELKKYKDEIIELEGFGKKSFDNLANSIESAKRTELPRFIYALGINQVGLSNAKLLCKQLDYDIEKIKAADIAELMKIEGFGEVIAKSITDYFSDEKNLSLLEKALCHLEFEKLDEKDENTALSGISFAVTGELNEFKNRNELIAVIKAGGGNFHGSVTKNTNYLINNDTESTSSKNKKAKELNIPIISEADFKKLFIS